MKLSRAPGATSQILQIFIADSSSTTGDGLTGLAHNSAGLTAYYHRDNDTTATAITLVTMTVGTFTSSGFKEVDATNMPGVYQFCPPNAALAVGASSVAFFLKGATDMAPLPIEIDLNNNTQTINGVSTGDVTDIHAHIGSEDEITGYDLQLAGATTTTVTLPATDAHGVPIPDDGLRTYRMYQVVAGTGAGKWFKVTTATGSARQYTLSVAMGVALDSTSLLYDWGSYDANVVYINGVATTSVTTVGANVGTTQPVNFTGTGATAYVKVDNLLWLGSAIATPTTSGVPEVDLTHALGTALSEGASGRLAGGMVKFFNVASPTGTVNSLPDVVPGAAGGLFIAGSNAATTVATLTCSGAFSTGAATFSTLSVTGAFNIGTNLAIGGSLSIVAAATIGGNVNISGTFGAANLLISGTTGLTGGITAGASTISTLTVTSGITANITGNLIGTVSTVTSVTTVNGLAANVITAAAIAGDANAEIAAAVWDLPTSGHVTSGTFGAAMAAAGASGDPWSTTLPGAYGAGTAGHIVGTAIPDVAPGASGGLLIAGSNALTTFASVAITSNMTIGGTFSPNNITAGTVTINSLTNFGATTLSGAVTAANASNDLRVNVAKINSVTVTGAGVLGNEWDSA